MANFLGKKISLISKAGIRYEGILYTIDQTAFTVALSKVKSFGTEDRSAERYIASRDEVYEYIIFRGSDISDLHVCENSMYTDDSAIVKITNAQMSPNPQTPSSPPAATPKPIGVYTDAPVPDTKTIRQEPSSPVSQPPISVNKRFMDFSKTNNRNDESGSGQKKDHSNHRNAKPNLPYMNKYDNEDLEEIAAQDYRNFQNREQTAKTDSFDPSNVENRRYPSNRRATPRQRGGRNMEYNQGYQSGGGGGRGRALRTNNEGAVDVIKDDFDFESSNALMAEELAHMNVVHDVAREPARGDHVEVDTVEECSEDKAFYDKTKSFFDNISSEVSDRSGGTSDRRHKSNMETFGSSEYGRGRGNRWNTSRGAFRGNYGRAGTVGFIRRGGPAPRGDIRMGRGQYGQRRPLYAGGPFPGLGQEN